MKQYCANLQNKIKNAQNIDIPEQTQPKISSTTNSYKNNVIINAISHKVDE